MTLILLCDELFSKYTLKYLIK